MAAVESGLPKVQQEQSEALRIVADNNRAENVPKDEPRVSSSECVVSMEKQLEQHHRDDGEASWAKLSIYRIPNYLKNGNKKAYVPQIVSLGPYHHGKDHLPHMDQHKLYIDSVKKVEQRARSYYDGQIFMSSCSFVEMMVLDGCFVIELLQGVTEGFEKLGYPSNDPVFSKWGSMLKIQIQRDMILLENQIPLFILAQLLGLQPGNPDPEGRVGKLVLKFFNPYGSEWLKFDTSRGQCGLHCLEVLWQNFLPSGLKQVGLTQARTKGWQQNRDELIPRLTKLVEAGIKFRCGCMEILGDIQFELEYGILEIPSIEIHQGTRQIFLNLIAFEQSHFDCRDHITSYVIFMHNLINSSEDVRYLYNRGIINHCLGSDAEVADLFNLLCQEVAFDIEDSYLVDVSYEVNLYCKWKSTSCRASIARKWNAWRAILENKYFDNPWSIISFMAAVVLLVLTFLQALYAVYGYYKSRS
ncbi:hypothetical protein EUGRSUZ_I00854 [Eucalyptus grandis]|uniref:Uncharacterized protein n=2 Tax=Eucalyptus grandis TaxID=71139 RepID=A0A059AM20_EUCGR|nr:hypothetical protein EUGRSUZ_I00854 [Eucalyptus grandis]